MMKRILSLLLSLALLLGATALAGEAEVSIVLSDDGITVDGAPIGADSSAAVYLAEVTERHEDVPEDLTDVVNRVVTITAAGSYRIRGAATDVQIRVQAGETDTVRLILDGADLSCRTAPAILGVSAYESGAAGAYGLTIELADGSENRISGSHTAASDGEVEYDGAIDSLISLGFEGGGSLELDADNEGIEVQRGHLTINGGTLHIYACDDPLNVSEDGVGVLTINDGYLCAAVKDLQDAEGDGLDSNGAIVINGGTVIGLAHPTSMDSGIDSDLGSAINGGVVVGAGNMYDPLDAASGQLFMSLEFAQATEGLLVITDSEGAPVFAYELPHPYRYVCVSTPAFAEGESYRVYLGGEIEGAQQDGLYSAITAYTPGTLLQHGSGGLERGDRGPEAPDRRDGGMRAVPEGADLNELLADADLNALLAGKDLNGLLTGFRITDLFSQEEIAQYFGDMVPGDVAPDGVQPGDGQPDGAVPGDGQPKDMVPGDAADSDGEASSAFVLTKGGAGFANVAAA